MNGKFKMWVQLIGKLELWLEITWGNALKEYVTHLLAKPVPSVGTPASRADLGS